MGRGGPTPWASVAAVAAIACCALLPAIVAGAGVATGVAGAAVRFWPLVLVGVALAGWAAARTVRAARRRRGSWSGRAPRPPGAGRGGRARPA